MFRVEAKEERKGIIDKAARILTADSTDPLQKPLFVDSSIHFDPQNLLSLPPPRSAHQLPSTISNPDAMRGHDRINTCLPDELIFEVFRRLDSKPSRDACSLVCKRWLALERLSRTTLRIGATGSPDLVVDLLARLFRNVRTVHIDERLNISLPTHPVITQPIRSIPNSGRRRGTDIAAVSSVRLHSANGSGVLDSNSLSDAGMTAIGDGFPKLEKLSLIWCSNVSSIGLISLADKCKMLKSLDLQCFYGGMAHAIGDILTGDVVEPEVFVSASPSIRGLLDSLTASLGTSSISSRAKPVAAPVASSTPSDIAATGTVTSDAHKTGSRPLDKDALRTFVTSSMPFGRGSPLLWPGAGLVSHMLADCTGTYGTPLDLSFPNILSIRVNGFSSSDLPLADLKQPAWKPCLYKGRPRILSS
ncbi:hypothetical protein C1H46_014656 [Malus baccata]|uniref:F-box domain-containing protein n=1 Tax=Malus baccata TaxID=106549 RepID=A0A540MLR7_MALBA|nr:hypothetical protein C1H46_014656 [Malus baccata]